jgi:hypothetical protein
MQGVYRRLAQRGLAAALGRRARQHREQVDRAVTGRAPTITFSITLRLLYRRMFWEVRDRPAPAMACGRRPISSNPGAMSYGPAS